MSNYTMPTVSDTDIPITTPSDTDVAEQDGAQLRYFVGATGTADNTFRGDGRTITYTGGAGSDLVDYGRSDSAIRVDLTGRRTNDGDAEGDTFLSIENITGTDFDDRLYGDDADNRLSGGGGDDYIEGENGDDRLDGGSGDDILKAGNGDDRLDGGSGRDELQGGSGSDILNGGDGSDRLLGGRGSDVLNGGAGSDLLIGGDGDGADILNGGDGRDTASYSFSDEGVVVDLGSGTGRNGTAEGDTLISIENLQGSDYDDDLTGNAENNFLLGEDGNDTLIGAGGDDTLNGGDGRDRLEGGSGTDTLNGGEGSDYFLGGKGADTIDGGEGRDMAAYRLSDAGVEVDLLAGTARGGTAEGDTFSSIENLAGSDFGDILAGDDETNAIWSGDGVDVLTGNGGADVFSFTTDETGFDVVTDFSIAEGDRLLILGRDADDGWQDDVEITQNGGRTEVTFFDQTVILDGIEGGTFTEEQLILF